jgi:hypothetical protein
MNKEKTKSIQANKDGKILIMNKNDYFNKIEEK